MNIDGLPPSPDQRPADDPNWLKEFEDLANQTLDHGSSCEQVHPVVERWYERLVEGEPPSVHDRDSVQQAMACLTTELLNTLPDPMYDLLTEMFDEDDLATWTEFVLMIGRAFERSLHNGELDDL
ncbi:MAG: hypothetical protein SF162_09710 [bacterium]|nr:hypothetical protein [bacterium]